jgi:hypothetical protein
VKKNIYKTTICLLALITSFTFFNCHPSRSGDIDQSMEMEGSGEKTKVKPDNTRTDSINQGMLPDTLFRRGDTMNKINNSQQNTR